MARYFFHLLGPGEAVLRDDDTGPAGRSLQIADEQATVLKSLYSDAVA